MSNGTYPGVYIKEVSSGVRPIQAAGTSTAAFFGVAERGPIGIPKKVFNFTEYARHFGGFLDGCYLSHAVFQFFNNGGTQCYIVRVTGENTETARIVLNDRGNPVQESLAIEAISPGVWGNSLAVVVRNGTKDSANEFDLIVYRDGELSALETYVNLSVVPTAPNFVDKIIASSNYIRATFNQHNGNAMQGTSKGSGKPDFPVKGTKFRINIDGDGYQEVNLQEGVGQELGQAEDLTTLANIAKAIRFVVGKLRPQHAVTNPKAFQQFACEVIDNEDILLLTSGYPSFSASVNVAPATKSDEDASASLKLGARHNGIETIGGAPTRPKVNPAGTPPENYYLVGGDYSHFTNSEVSSTNPGSDGDSIKKETPFIEALSALDTITDVSLIAIPGIGLPNVADAGMNYCQNRRPLSDCFFIADMASTDDTKEKAEAYLNGIFTPNSYGAVYFPWLKMSDPIGVSNEPILVPPSGFVAGLYARVDANRGVWKAPAGTEAMVAGAVGLGCELTDPQHGDLNTPPKSVCVIRKFSSSGIVLWGARTLSSDAEYKYIPVRRMAIMLRKSIYNGIQWAVFEPNDEGLWSQLRLNIGSFMMTLFRQGAFQGSTPSQAFFVKCDSETTTQDDINLGVVNVLVGFAPLKPAEFVIVKISQKAGQAS